MSPWDCNTHKTQYNKYIYKSNGKIRANDSVIFGDNNLIRGYNNFIRGNGNQIYSPGWVFGDNNKIYAPCWDGGENNVFWKEEFDYRRIEPNYLKSRSLLELDFNLFAK